jgi:peptide deformylase
MALLEILQYPDPRLHIKAERVTKIDDEIRRIVDDMYETMYHAKGVGLAATQVGINLQIFTADASEERDQPVCVLNPEILNKSGSRADGEGCLSVVGFYDKVKRAETLRLRGMRLNGEVFEEEADGFWAHIIQHETDHLNGILFINHLSRLKQTRIRDKILKDQRG